MGGASIFSFYLIGVGYMFRVLFSISLIMITFYTFEAYAIMGPISRQCQFSAEESQLFIQHHETINGQTKLNWVETQVFDSFVESFREKALEQASFNNNLYSDFWSLVQAQWALPQGFQQSMSLSLEVDHLEGCWHPFASGSDIIKNLPDDKKANLKHFAFKLQYEFFDVSVFPWNESDRLTRISLDRIISLEGSIITDTSCDNPISCDEIYFVLFDKTGIRLRPMYPVGGSSSAGGILYR
jgi:hypothetical protein